MVKVQGGDIVAQRPDALVTYQVTGWTGGEVTLEHFRPRTGTTVPVVTSGSGTVTIQTRVSPTSCGTPGAWYRLRVGEQALTLIVSWYVPSRPVKGPEGQVTGVTHELIPKGQVWVADQPRDLGSGRLVPVKAPK